MKTIIVPTDFSEYSEKATIAASQIARKTGAKIILFHSIFVDSRWMTMTDAQKEKYPETLAKIKKAEQQLKKLIEHSKFKGISTESTIAFGVPYSEIVNFSQKKKADIIIMGSHGNEGSERFYIGSNIQKVLRHASCPVLTVKKNAIIKNWKKLIFATNLSGKIEKTFLPISKIAKALNLNVHLLFVNRPGEFLTTREANKKMDDFSKQYPETKFNKTLYCHRSIEDGILEFAEDIDADWIAMCPHAKNSKPGYLIGNTEVLVYRSNIPVMSAHM